LIVSATILDGRAIAVQVWAETRARAAELADAAGPRLAVVHLGDDPSAASYLRQIGRSFQANGLHVADVALPLATSQDQLEAELRRLSADAATHGILLQTPFPPGARLEAAVQQLAVEKDVEGLHPFNAGLLAQGRPRFVPTTPLAGLEILRRCGYDLVGKRVTVVGRSRILGLPLSLLAIQAHATVTVCHSRTADLAEATRSAEILLVATGRPGLVSGPMIRPGAVVIDFGTTYVGDHLSGDVEFESACQVASAITPVPGGVGPVTAAMLGRNLLQAAEAQLTAT
jgi:methylenetetrahydrofolate dehydrogenase (NADP+) / methenyltetrahydrofolate cyclohydrolase